MRPASPAPGVLKAPVKSWDSGESKVEGSVWMLGSGVHSAVHVGSTAAALYLTLLVGNHFACRTTAQAPGGALVIPSVTDTQACDWPTLPAKVEELNAVCCFGLPEDAAACSGQLHCNVTCATVLLPLLDSCGPILGMLFDVNGADAARDGTARVLQDLYRACLQIDSADVLARLKSIEAQGTGRCAHEDFDGVAETAVAALPCQDMREGCEGGIQQGFVTCSGDFGPGRAMAGECDLTCGFCIATAPSPPPAACTDARDACSVGIASGFFSCETE